MKIYIFCTTTILLSTVTCRRRWTTRSTTKSTIPPAVFESNLTNFDPENVWDPFADDYDRYDLDLAYYDNVTEPTTTKKPPTTKNIYYNDTIDYKGVIRFFRIYNKTPYDLRVHEVTYAEYLNETKIHGRYWRHLPVIEAYHDSRKQTFTMKNFTNPQIEQRWTCVVTYNNKTYTTIRPSVVHLIPGDCVYVTYLVVDELKEKLVVIPPKSGQSKAYLHPIEGNLTYSNPQELETEFDKTKTIRYNHLPEDRYEALLA